MFKDGFVVSVVLGGNVTKETQGIVQVPFDSEYALRIKSKYATPVAVDIFIDGSLANEIGHIFLAGNSSLDIDQWVTKDGKAKKFLFTNLKDSRVAEPNESENGRIEVRFYKPTEKANVVETTYIIRHEHWPYYPVWPIYIERPHYWDNPYWTYTNNGGTSGIVYCSNSSNVSMNISSEVHTGLEANGATVKGRTTEKKDMVKVDFSLQTEPVSLTLMLIGVKRNEALTMYCKECGRRVKDKENYCPKCGEKL